jgi:hypothetical protein
MTYSILHSVSQVLVLAGLLSAFFTTLIVWLKLRKHMRDEWGRSRLTSSASGERQDSLHTPTTLTSHWPVILIATSAFLTGLYIGNLRGEFRHQQFDEMQDVTIIQRTDPYTFKMQVDDPDTHKPREFGVRFCPDYEPTHEFQPGVKLSYLKFQRHDFDNCWEIAPENLGYSLWRDNANKPIIFGGR